MRSGWPTSHCAGSLQTCRSLDPTWTSSANSKTSEVMVLKRCTSVNKWRELEEMIWLWWVLKGIGLFAEVAETATTANKLPLQL